LNSIFTIQHAASFFATHLSLPAKSTLFNLARQCGFVRREPRKLDPESFVISCLLLALQKGASLRRQAVLAGTLAGSVISKQGLHQRLSGRIEAFLQACLAAVLSSRLAGGRSGSVPAGFSRVLLQDSTCLALSPALAARFPGPANQSGKPAASLRLQCLYDLGRERFVSFLLSPFTRNDQSAAHDVVGLLRPGDLLMRDLGYFSLSSLTKIADLGAFFLTRLRYGVRLSCSQTGRSLVLAELLQPGVGLDLPVLLGPKGALRARLLAFPLPAATANERRRKARADRDKRLRHAEDYYHLLGWAIYLTNADDQQLPAARVPPLYRLRWRIEIVFKAWKSHWGLASVRSAGPRQVAPLIYGALLLIALTHHQPLRSDDEATAPPPISLLRLAGLAADWFMPLLFAGIGPDELCRRLRDQGRLHARYDRRRKRKNYISLRQDSLG